MVINRSAAQEEKKAKVSEETSKEALMTTCSIPKQVTGFQGKVKTIVCIYAVVAQLVEQLHGGSQNPAHGQGNLIVNPE